MNVSTLQLIAIFYKCCRELDVQLCQLGQNNCFMVNAQLVQTRLAVLLNDIANILLIMQIWMVKPLAINEPLKG